MKTKICGRCKIRKPIKQFCKDRSTKSGLHSRCRECIKIDNEKHKIKRQKYYQDNKASISLKNKQYRELNKAKLAIYYKKNKNKRNEQYKKWYYANRDYQLKQHKKWREKNQDRHRANYIKWKNTNYEYLKRYRKNRRKQIHIKLIDNIRRRINIAIKNKNRCSIDYLGIDIQSYQIYLKKLFQKGMTWNNYGKWHIDHIVPLSSAKNEEELIKLFHYTNTQPLWAEDNLKKSNKIS